MNQIMIPSATIMLTTFHEIPLIQEKTIFEKSRTFNLAPCGRNHNSNGLEINYNLFPQSSFITTPFYLNIDFKHPRHGRLFRHRSQFWTFFCKHYRFAGRLRHIPTDLIIEPLSDCTSFSPTVLSQLSESRISK